MIIMLLLTGLAAMGCSDRQRPGDLPKLYPCELTITQEGTPLSGANVTLFPAEETNAKYQASSITNSEGKATLKTYGFDGIPAGKYKVCVRKVIGEENAEYQTVERQYSDSDKTPHEIEIIGGKTFQTSLDVGKAVKSR